MEKRSNDSGLFLKNYLGTVSAAPRPRAAVRMESNSPYAHSASIDIENCIKHLTEDDTYNYKNSYETHKVIENGIKPGNKEKVTSEYGKNRIWNNNPVEADVNRIEYYDEDKDKKKEKKWTIGGFFRRKCRKDADNSSEDSGDGPKGFLSRRKSKRDRRKTRAKTTANGFDVIIPQQKEQVNVNGIGKAVDELWGNGDVKSANNGPVRYIYRHQPNGLPESGKPKDTLQVPRCSRRDSNLSRNSSGGSGSLEGRKGRKEVLARAEAKRDQMRDDSSSDENESYHSSSSLNRLTAEGRRRRHNKRLSKDDESLVVQNGDFRVVKSDLEGHRLPHNRWIPRGYNPDSSDHENVKFSLINHSATPSPARSPRAKQKQLNPNMSSLALANSYAVSTFPPGIHYPQGRNVPSYNGLFPNSKYIQTKDSQVHISQPIVHMNYRKSNRNSEFIQPARRSTSEHSTNRRTLMDYEQFLSSCGSNREKSLSYDQDMHRAFYFENDSSDAAPLQYSTPKAQSIGMHVEPLADGRKRDPSPRDARRMPALNSFYELSQRMLKTYENDRDVLKVGNSLPVQHHNYPIVQRSASGNSFSNLCENSNENAYNQSRSSSYQHIPSYINQQSRKNPERLKTCVQYPQNGMKFFPYRTMTDTVTANPGIVRNDAKENFNYTKEQAPSTGQAEALPKPQLNNSVPNLRYYADQNPRSRNPIHITCNATPSPTHEQPKEPAVVKTQSSSVKEAITNASDFWKLKDQENMMNIQLKRAGVASPSSKPPLTQMNSRAETTRSASPKPKENSKEKNNGAVKTNHGKAIQEETLKVNRSPADTASRKSAKPETQSKPKADSNLDDALNELESIYNSLRLGDEDLTSKAERREVLTFNSGSQKSGRNDQFAKGITYEVYPSHEHQRAVPQRRSGVPDKVNDDMAYRRMNTKDRSENKKFPPHSYLRSSPALSPVMGDNPNNLIQKEPSHEPDITYDDVVFRNIRHANSTLKIQDPQPPFGIPLGPITPAPNSDYLHATPKERFRPSFTCSKIPDVVKDDLAFRNLRKDNMTANLPVVENPDTKKLSNPNYLLQKKRAVRSLSANLYNLIQKESSGYPQVERNNNILEKDCEKTQSLTDLSEKDGKKTLEKRLKELKEEKNAKRAEFFELAKEQRKKRNSKSKLSWTELAHLNGDFENVPQVDTSTETLTEDKENRCTQQRLRVNFNSEEPVKSCQAQDTKTYRSPIVELSKYPAAAPSSTLYSNPFREPTPGSPLDEAELEDLLSALEKEAKSASEDLGRQLVALELSAKEEEKHVLSEEAKRRSASVSSEKPEETTKQPPAEKNKNVRSKSGSISAVEKDAPPEETEKVGTSNAWCSAGAQPPAVETKAEEEVKSDEDVGKLANEIIQITEELMRRESKDRKRSSIGFEVVTDLSQILHEMEEHQTAKPQETFQEVYEYNIGLTEGVNGCDEVDASKEDVQDEKESSAEKDIEREFEKLHMEVGALTTEADEDDIVVKELIADVTSGSGTTSDSYSPRPFPNEVSSKSVGVRCRDGSSPGSSNGEETSQVSNDPRKKRDVSYVRNKGILMKMFDTGEEEEKERTLKVKIVPVANPSSGTSLSHRKELLAKINSRMDTTKPFKSSKRKEDLRGGGWTSPSATSCARSYTSENQVPSSDSHRYISRRDQNKTDAHGSSDNDTLFNKMESESQPSVLVRETKTSRLRAASRSSISEAGSPGPRKTPDREKRATTSSSASSASNSLSKREVDKSHKRKSYLNRSYTSEEVCNDIHSAGGSLGTRGRSTKCSDLKKSVADDMPTPANKVEVPKFLSNGSCGTSTKITKPLPWNRKSLGSNDRNAPQRLTNGEKCHILRKQTSVEEKKIGTENHEPKSISSNLKQLEDRFRARRSPASIANGTDSSQTRRNSKSSPDDFAKRADLLAAATLKMINRLDEINKQSRKNQTRNKQNLIINDESSSSSSGDRISFHKAFKTFDSDHKPVTKKVPVPDENTAKCYSSSILNRRNSRQKSGIICSKPIETFKLPKESSKVDSLREEATVKPSSILKNKVTTDALPSNSENRKQKPVSILKRKSLPQDDKTNFFSSPPVTFSPSVIENENPKRQGILKKRRSLDESEVLRRRNATDSTAEFKPILKNQRRSSLEDLSGRSRSPDYLPQSILKRKSSRDEETEDLSGSEPQGILKRKSISGHQHVKISDSTAMVRDTQISENIRPILKKKSSSEEHSTPELSLSEPPRPILKKKSSLEVEEEPKKPILKTSRKTSLEDDETKRCRTFSAVEPEHIKPILKRENSRPRLPETEPEVVLRRVKPNRFNRPLSSSDVDDELNAIFNKRRSLVFPFTSAMKMEWELRRSKSVSLNDRVRTDALRRPSSVAEKVNTLEHFLHMERERQNFSPCSTSPISPVSPSKMSPTHFPAEGAAKPSKTCAAGASTRPYEVSPFRHPGNGGRTFFFDGASSPSTSNCNEGVKISKISDKGKSSDSSEDENEICRCKTLGPKSPVRLSPLGRLREAGDTKSGDSSHNNDKYHSTDSELSSNGLSNDQDDSEYVSAVEFCSRKISSLDVKDTESESNCPENMEEAKEVAEEIFLLQKSGSVTAKASIFQELEKKFKTAAEERTKPKPKEGNRGINRYREKKLLESNAQKYHTQPVSSQDVEEAIRNTRSYSTEKPADAENFEDQLSSMSLSDRVRLFNERIRRESNASPPPPGPVPVRKRGPRFRTQPVTTEEVETAQGQKRISPLAASLMRPPDHDLFGLGVLSAQSMKEKIYDHANAILKAKSEAVEEKGSKRKGILKNFGRSDYVNEGDRRSKTQSSESDSSDSEIKSILKSEENPQRMPRAQKSEENLVLKGILKQPSAEKKATTSSEESSFSDDGDIQREKQRNKIHGTNLASILQSVEPIKINDEKASDGEGSSSGGREVHKYFKNEAVARRRQIALNKIRNSSSLVKSQSHSAVSSICRSKTNDGHKDHVLNGERDGVKCKGSDKSSGDGWKEGRHEDGSRYDGLRRSTTQPLGDFDRQTDDDLTGATIQERLARLKKSGENDWQKRKTLVANSEDLSVITSGINLFGENCVLRNQRTISPQSAKETDDLRSSILADRLDKLDAAKEDWRKRVQPSDAVQFSVEGKMLGRTEGLSRSPLLHNATNRAPLAERKKRCPKPVPFRSRKQPSLNSVPSSPMDVISNPIARSVSAPGSGQDGLFSLSDVEGPVVSVPKTDDETFTSFFNGLCSDVAFEERLDIKDEDLDVVSKMQSSQLLVQKRNVRIQRRRATVKNPLKILAARKDLQEYTEIKTGIAEKELRRLKVEKASRNSTLAIEALAGLASQEDFTAINLKKASDNSINSPAPPFKSLMLLQIKGRRHVQTRMVEPVAKSINSGDCFILVTPKKLFHYIGEYANVIEKSRSAEISLHIQQNSDLGCTTNAVITTGGGGRATSDQVKEFWKLLGDERGQERPAGHPDEDEIFESAIVDTNMIYEVVNDELVPVEAFWGSIPRIEVLDSNKVLVFDFGSEFYLWIGKNVNLADRKVALKLAKELWEEGYDYVDCDVCPLSLNSYFRSVDEGEELPESKKAGPARPSWALFAKITENMETVLFREKFLDWPDYSRVIRRSKKDQDCENIDGNGIIEAKPCDAKAMLEHVRSEPDLVLEGNHLGRGVRYFEEETRRCAEVTTRDVTVWHISEYEYSELPPGSVGHFYMEDSYVVRWHYMITITGRELSGQPSKHLTVGRDRYAYFCWQGRDSPINDKGAAACLTVELDKEHGPQIRISQGFEPPAFLNLFQGSMVVHSGRRESDGDPKKHRLYICRGDEDTEAVLFEVPASMRQLRSAASFVLVNNERGLIIVWHGLKSPEHAQRMALNAAKHIQTGASIEFSFKTKDLKIREEEEGNESMEFIRSVGGDKRQLYFSFLDNKQEDIKTPRLFHLSSVSGEFLFSEISPVSYNKDLVSPYPFLQEDLYSAPQPALFMIDTGYCLWLWQGWWEAESGEGDRGSGILRFQAERRAAMTTAISYWNLKYGNRSPKAYLVWAGLEPLMFTNLFPMWTDRDQISEINMKEGRKPGEIVLVKTELASLMQSTYPLAQLLTRPLPDGVNPSFLEDYLEPQCFKTLFGMTGEEFHNLPSWKKKKLKQDVGLF